MKMIDRILRLIDDRRTTQQRVESAAGLSHGRISKWKGNKGEPSAREALRIARHLGCPVEWLIDDAAPDDPGALGTAASADDADVLEMVRRLGLDKIEALRRLAQGGPSAPYAATAEELAELARLRANRERLASNPPPSPAPPKKRGNRA